MPEKLFKVDVPCHLDDNAEIVLTVLDKDLLGSERHILRFDLYPFHAPSHPDRHHGYWDVPMKRVRRERTVFQFRDGNLRMKRALFPITVAPTWRGDLTMSGISVLSASIMDIDGGTARTLWTQRWTHALGRCDDLPLKRVTLLVTRKCNLKCDLCWREFFQEFDEVHMLPEVFDAVARYSPSLTSVLLHGDGEPLLHPGLPQMLTTLKETMPSTGRVGTLTNGMLLTTDRARDLIDRGLDWLSVSLDGATKETQESIRRGSDFHTIMTNVANAVKYARQSSSSRVQFNLQFTIREANVREFPELARLAGKLGVQNVSAGILIRYSDGEFCAVDPAILEEAYEEAGQVARAMGVGLNLQASRPLDPQRCFFLEEVFVNGQGDVAACSFRHAGRPERHVQTLGNVLEKPLDEIWGSSRCVELRRKVTQGIFDNGCSTCGIKTWGCPTST